MHRNAPPRFVVRPSYPGFIGRILAILSLALLLALPSNASAQFSDGQVEVVTYKGNAGSFGGIPLPYYSFDIAGMPGSPYWDFFCVDNLNFISGGPAGTFEARFTSVEDGDLQLTREGSDQVRAIQPLTVALNNYRISAYLYLQAQGADDATLAALQQAAWYATDPGYAAGNNSYYTAAQTAVTAGFTAEDFYVVTATADLEGDGLIRATGGKQEYLVHNTNTVPEPGSMILLATGLIGVAVVGRRRRLVERGHDEAEA